MLLPMSLPPISGNNKKMGEVVQQKEEVGWLASLACWLGGWMCGGDSCVYPSD